jgi:hypothetical protein
VNQLAEITEIQAGRTGRNKMGSRQTLRTLRAVSPALKWAMPVTVSPNRYADLTRVKTATTSPSFSMSYEARDIGEFEIDQLGDRARQASCRKTLAYLSCSLSPALPGSPLSHRSHPPRPSRCSSPPFPSLRPPISYSNSLLPRFHRATARHRAGHPARLSNAKPD